MNDRKLLYRGGEVVRLVATDDNPEEYATIIGTWDKDDIYDDDGFAAVLLFPEYRKNGDDDGLRDVPLDQIRKQYDHDQTQVLED